MGWGGLLLSLDEVSRGVTANDDAEYLEVANQTAGSTKLGQFNVGVVLIIKY